MNRPPNSHLPGTPKNPYLILQEFVELTNDSLAGRAGVTDQVVRNNYLGLFNRPNIKITRALLSALSDRGIERGTVQTPDTIPTLSGLLVVTPEGLEMAYLTWRRSLRASANHYVRSPVTFKLGYRPKTHPFTTFRTSRFGPNRKTFCKMLALPPQTVERFEAGTSAVIPDAIVEALLDAGINQTDLRALSSRVIAYSAFHREGRPIPGGLAR